MTTTPGMILLDVEHPIVEKLVYEKLSAYNTPGKDGKALEIMNVKIADFDGVVYQVMVEKGKTDTMKINLFMQGFKDVAAAGGNEVIQSMYGDFKKASQDNADVTFEIPASSLSPERMESVAKDFSLLKRNILAQPLKKAFTALAAGKASSINPFIMQIRPQEQIIVAPASDRVNVVVSFDMEEKTDAAFAEQILDQIAKASSAEPNSPNVKFSKDIPNDIVRVSGVNNGANTIGYLMFTMYSTHVEGKQMDESINLLLTVRHYVHYHVKASKAHLHQRMRAKVKSFLQVLNRAKLETEVKKKGKNKRVINL